LDQFRVLLAVKAVLAGTSVGGWEVFERYEFMEAGQGLSWAQNLEVERRKRRRERGKEGGDRREKRQKGRPRQKGGYGVRSKKRGQKRRRDRREGPGRREGMG
jgi:hypothetical protein